MCKIMQNVKTFSKGAKLYKICKIEQIVQNLQKCAKLHKIVHNLQNCAELWKVCKIVQKVQNFAKLCQIWFSNFQCIGGTSLWHFSAISLLVQSLAHILASTWKVTGDSDNFCNFWTTLISQWSLQNKQIICQL